MDGMLSQEEINALFSNMDDGPASGESAAVSGGETMGAGAPLAGDVLSDIEKDAIGEISNISMGTAATTLNALVGQSVNITTPTVSYSVWGDLAKDFQTRPCVALQLGYKEGLDGNNILVLKEQDVLIITDLMMGGDGKNVIDTEINELHLSAISEAMNQMMGSSATSLSTMINQKIDILPPVAKVISFDSDLDLDPNFIMPEFIKVSFKLTIGDLVNSEIMQLYPIDFASKLYNMFSGQGEDTTKEPEPSVPSQPDMGMPQQTPQMNMNSQMGMPQMNMDPSQMQMGMNPQMMGMPQMNMGMPQMNMNPQMGMGMPQMNMDPSQMQMGMNPQMMGMPYGMPYQMPYGMPQEQANVQQAQFQPFINPISPAQMQENIDLIMDVPLEITVELGKTTRSIKDILEFAPGSIIELNKIAGEPIDVLVNGKYVAKGEVVVIEESFAIRVTEIFK